MDHRYGVLAERRIYAIFIRAAIEIVCDRLAGGVIAGLFVTEPADFAAET